MPWHTTGRALATAGVVGALALAVPAVAAPSAPPAPRPLTGVHAQNGELLDADGRQVLLRGVNIVDKSGWNGKLATPMLDDGKVRQLASLGFNHVRLGTTWSSIEHERGQYDEAYIAQLRQQLDVLAAQGMSAVLDMHQDTWSKQLGADGAPAWADPQCSSAPDADLDKKTGAFFLEYASPAVSAAFTNFWHDGYGDVDPHCTGPVQRAFVDMWGHLAFRLGGHRALIGYDILNEPWPGFIPAGVFESQYLAPFYERVTAAIREHDRATPVVFEPVAIYQTAVPYAAAAPDPNSIFAQHVYAERETGQEEVTAQGLGEEVMLSKGRADADRLGVPRWIGEWGNTKDASYLSDMYDLFDRERLGSALWNQVQQPGQRFPQDPAVEAPHVRPYVELAPGTATWAWDAEASAFTATITTTRAGVAQIVVPPRLGLRDVAVTKGKVRFAGGGSGSTTCARKSVGPCRLTWVLPTSHTATITLSR